MINPVVPAFLLLSTYAVTVSCDLDSCAFDREDAINSILSSAVWRRSVDLEYGVNVSECLNGSVPCRTLHYALHGTEIVEERSNVKNLVIELSPGTYVLTDSQVIVNSANVAILGAGAEKTIFNCGEFGEDDKVCDYMNLQIRNSSNVYVYGVTFTRCGPITSSVYVAFSDAIFFKNCVFRDSLSPSLLIHNTPTVVLESCRFSNNHPAYLTPNITRNLCYFSESKSVFFTDNRTTSGGISFYIQELRTTFLLINCTFSNNSARPDYDVSLIRRSETYGHGGALNIRLLQSSNSVVCILNSTFVGNSAQAHGGGVVLLLAGSASNNNFVISQSRFERNICTASKSTGGGVGLDLLAGSQFNTIEILKCTFIGNSANASGAISLSTSVSAEISDEGLSDKLVLRKCLFMKNEAFFEGTALGAYSLTHTDQIGIPLEIHDCEFRDNVGIEGSGDTASITVYRVLVSFYGHTSFIKNVGGGVSLLSSRMDVQGNVTFHRNTAVYGAGVAMSGRSLILLYNGSYMEFSNNVVSQVGAGIYVEYASSDFLLSVLNTGCFIRYYTLFVDLQPSEWDSKIIFANNTAMLAGAGIYASDMSRCKWLGNLTGNYTIFQIPPDKGPFHFSNNTVQDTSTSSVNNHDLATESSQFSVVANFNTSNSPVAFGERVPFQLNSADELGNFREAVWSVSVPLEAQPLGSVSSNNSRYVYSVPDKSSLTEVAGFSFLNGSEQITANFSLLQSLSVTREVKLNVSSRCHPGYQLDHGRQECVCMDYHRDVVRCDTLNRYFYTRDGYWVGVRENGSFYTASAVPGFLSCSRLGTLPGCEFRFDDRHRQCAARRRGKLCGDCLPGYGTSFDLRFCLKSNCDYGIALFVAICIITLLLSLAILYYDFPLPNELKGVIFFAQVIGVIYRNTPYLLPIESSDSGLRFLDFLINMLGFAMPFPICFYKDVSAFHTAFLGFIPPIIATLTAILYSCCANRSRKLSHREKYGFHGFYFLFLFVYKYFVDTSFTFISCTSVDGDSVFLYQGTLSCYAYPFVIMLVVGSVLIVALVIALPLYTLYIIYRPAKMIQFSNALTHGLKEERSCLWYSVWDIWRRVLFVGANLFISVTTRSVVLFIHCLLIILCLCVLCFVKPYKKYHINLMEMVVLLSLFGATVCILDENDLYVGSRISASFIAIPFLYGLFFIIFRVSRRITIACWSFALKRWQVVRLEATVSSLTENVSNFKKLTVQLLEDLEDSKDQGIYERMASNDEDEVRLGSPELATADEQAINVLREPLLDEF